MCVGWPSNTVTSPDSLRVGQRHPMVEIHRLTLDTLAVDVYQHDRAHETVQQERMVTGGAQLPGTDDD